MKKSIIGVIVLALAGVQAPVFAAAPAWAPPVPVDVVSIPVKDAVGGTALPVKPPPRVGVPEQPAFPPASTDVVDLSGAAAVQAGLTRAGRSPVSVGRPAGLSAKAGSPPGKVGVRVFDQQAARRSGIPGVLVSLARADGLAQPGPVAVNLDYSGFATAYGGDWASRLRLVQLPACVLTTPEVKGCAAATPVPYTKAASSLEGQVTLASDGSPTLLAATAGPSGENGDYTATSLTPASTWQVSQQTGAFSWSYPLRLPAAAGGPAPSLTFSYSSQSVDGRTGGTNSQGSWVGDGWDLWTGYIERTYKSCAEDTDKVDDQDPNNKDLKTGDQCWWKANATMSLNGRSTELIDVGGGRWKGVSDDGSKVESTGGYWKVTTLDGTQYFFGKQADSNAIWSTQVYGNHPGEPGYTAGDFAASRRTQPWRWNLDYVVDPSGNTMSLFYAKETGAYGREGDPGKRTTYDRGGWLARIDYGARTDQAQPSSRVVFDVADRCLPGATCFDSSNQAVAASWPDTPWDQYCVSTCTTQLSPTFWTQKRLAKVRAQVWDTSMSPAQFRTVESWNLRQSYLNAGSSRREGVPMWLDGLTRTGSGIKNGASVSDPEVVFSPGADPFPNRVDGPSDGRTALNRFRIVSITTESGAQIGITYLPGDCTRAALPSAPTNTKRCMPQYYSPDGAEPTLDWFHKYVVSRIDVYDNTGGFTHEQTNYDYLDTPAWHYDNSELVKEKKRTWGQWRGYGKVRVRTGLESGPQTAIEYRYFRGMDGDKQTTGVRDVWVKDSLDGTGDPHSKAIEDHDALSGMERERITYDGLGGTWLTGTLTEPAFTQTGTNAQGGPLRSYMTSTAVTANRTHLTWNDTTRWDKTITKVNADNLPIEVADLGAESTTADDLCTRTTYLAGDAIRDKTGEVDVYGAACTATPSIPGDVVSMTRSYYDDPAKPYGTLPTRGLVVKTEEVGSWSGATPAWVTTATTSYDANGRTTSSADALGRTTATAYVPAVAGPVTSVTTTDALGRKTTKTMDIAWQQPTSILDVNHGTTELRYDAVGRLTSAWLPGRDPATQGANLIFAYALTGTSPTAVTTKKLLPNGTNKYLTSIAIFDGLLRSRQTQEQAVGGGRLISDTVYNTSGQIAWTSAPYYQDASPPGTTLVTPLVAIPSVTEKRYDGAGRVIEEDYKANGVFKWKTVTTFGGDRSTVTPPDGGTTTETLVDARGHTVELRQYRGAAFDATRYTYTHDGDLATVTDPGGNVWTYTYDQRGRKIKTVDPDLGTVDSTFDAAGQLLTTKDARDVVLAYTYDDLGRKTSLRDGSATGAKRAEWFYDTAAGGVGRPAKTIRYDGSNQYVSEVTGYDAEGRPLGSTLTIPPAEGALAGSYTFGTTYKQDGQIATTTTPAVGGLAAETISYGYNAVGDPTYLMSGSQTYVNDAIYNQIGQLTQRILGQEGARVWQTNLIDEPTGRAVSSSVVPELKNEVFDFGYTYSDAGDITRIADTPNGGQIADYQCYARDSLRRLTEAWTPRLGDCAPASRTVAALGGPAPYWHSYAYNTTSGRDLETWHGATDTVRDYVQRAQGHAVARVDKTGGASDTYGYDAAGNTTSRTAGATTTTMTWDSEGRLATSTQGGQTTTLLYTVDGDRMLRRDPGGTTLYLPGGLELRRSGGTVTGTRYYSHQGTAIAVRTAAGLAWTAQDHHNTAEAVIKASDLSVSRRRTLPFGGLRGSSPASWTGDKGFVNGTNDPSGLTHIGAREYDPLIGAFLSVDPVVDVQDPQQLQGYIYGGGNPVTMADPDGRIFGIKLPSLSTVASFVGNKVAAGVSAVGDFGASAGKWAYDHAGQISAVAGIAAMACSVIPPLQVLAPALTAVSVVAGAVQAGKDCSSGKGFDCAVGVVALVPGLGSLRAGTSVLRGTRALVEADKARKLALGAMDLAQVGRWNNPIKEGLRYGRQTWEVASRQADVLQKAFAFDNIAAGLSRARRAEEFWAPIHAGFLGYETQHAFHGVVHRAVEEVHSAWSSLTSVSFWARHGGI
ncbi:hypothetical protein J5X84_15380 [Streptosporangiaceae bacterium NEAU-GS5]|nr:hypothetical protein [Streptosporangiaceae bacterium NEAU-GS5]